VTLQTIPLPKCRMIRHTLERLVSSLVYVLPLVLRYEIQHRTATLRRIAQDAFLIAGWRTIRPHSTRKAKMKTILMLLAGCGSMENHVRNRDAVDTICACP